MFLFIQVPFWDANTGIEGIGNCLLRYCKKGNGSLKVLNLVKTSVGGTWAMRQMGQLVRSGIEVHAALPDRGTLYEEYLRCGIRVHFCQTDFPLGKPWLMTERISKLRRLVDAVDPDIVHSHFVGTTLTMRLALRFRPHLLRVFQVPGPLHLEQAFFRSAEISTSQKNDYWIGTCSATRERYLKAGINAKRVFLSYYGADLGSLVKRKIKGKLRSELKIDDRVPLIGMVAFIYKPKRMMGQRRGIKGHEDLIDAVAIAAEKVPHLRVVFVGGAWKGAEAYERKVRQYAEQKIPGRAFFLGTRNDVPELYGDFTIAVHPSHSENLGGAGESLLMAIPTIATNVGGFPDLVMPGKTGYLVPPKRPDKLAGAILHVLDNYDGALQMAVNGRRHVLEHNDVAKTARQVYEIYQTILAKR